MRLPRAKDVPATAAVSGVVFVLGLLNFDELNRLALILAAWGLMYVVEALIRRRAARRPVSGTPPEDRGHVAPPPGRNPGSTSAAGT